MKSLVILGAGTAGTAVANQIVRRLPTGWSVKIVDPEPEHLFQPDLIFVPFGMQEPRKMVRPRRGTLRPGVEWVRSAVSAVEPERRRVVLGDGDELAYDQLVIATGSHIRPDETPGLREDHWRKDIFDYYTLEGALALRGALERFEGGRVVLNVVEMPIKCPVAPLEFLFLAEDYFTRRGMRDAVDLVLATPLDGAFTRPIAASMLGSMLEERGIRVEAEFNTAEVDGERRVIRSYDEREVPYELLVSVPTHMGASFIGRSGLGNELDFIPTDPQTLAAKNHEDIFVLGDTTDLATSKAGSVAHFQSEVVVENLLRAMAGRSPEAAFDGHANCFIESGYGKAMLIDFNYQVEPLPGVYPLPVVGPMSLLRETRRNHWGKLAFRWVYWNMLLPGLKIPVPNRMSLTGKRTNLLTGEPIASEGDRAVA